MHHEDMDDTAQFSQNLDQLLLTLFDLRKSPDKIRDEETLKRLSQTCLNLEAAAKSSEKSADESLIYDAQLIWNWLALPFTINDHEISILEAAKEYQEKQNPLLSEVLKKILQDSEETNLILGDMSEISQEIHKIINSQ